MSISILCYVIHLLHHILSILLHYCWMTAAFAKYFADGNFNYKDLYTIKKTLLKNV